MRVGAAGSFVTLNTPTSRHAFRAARQQREDSSQKALKKRQLRTSDAPKTARKFEGRNAQRVWDIMPGLVVGLAHGPERDFSQGFRSRKRRPPRAEAERERKVANEEREKSSLDSIDRALGHVVRVWKRTGGGFLFNIIPGPLPWLYHRHDSMVFDERPMQYLPLVGRRHGS